MQAGQTGTLAGLDHIADGLLATGQGTSNLRGPLPARAGQQDLATAQYEGVARVQPGLDGGALVGGQLSDKDRWSHAPKYSRFPTALSEVALGTRRTEHGT